MEGPHGNLKRALGDALLLRGSRDFDVLADYRAFVDEVVGRRNSHRRVRVDAERAVLPPRRTDDFDTVRVRVIRSPAGVLLRAVRPSGAVPRGDAADDTGTRACAVRRPQRPCRGLPARDSTPCSASAWRCATWSTATSCSPAPRTAAPSTSCSTPGANGPPAATPSRSWSLAHERNCQAALAARLDASLDEGALPDPEALAASFAPAAASLPAVNVELGSLGDYDVLRAGRPAATVRQTAGGAS